MKTLENTKDKLIEVLRKSNEFWKNYAEEMEKIIKEMSELLKTGNPT
jgi:hypothetical protein